MIQQNGTISPLNVLQSPPYKTLISVRVYETLNMGSMKYSKQVKENSSMKADSIHHLAILKVLLFWTLNDIPINKQ